ncbi:ATP-binding protein [Spirosoma agri]|uniref:histidine kinase n=1 Tax=Spirosoma agri TaxID=1987381 RepID=A0A6M0IJX1_9BACT|nr:ATP-binding protein [Spirosoma agri]NEU68610.1 PAS domain-containing protein [Spirosoma agri]
MTDSNKSVDKKALNERLDVSFAMQAAGLGVWEIDPKTKQVLWDDQCRKLFGAKATNQFPYERTLAYIHPEDVSRVNQAIQQAMNPEFEGNYDVTYRIDMGDGNQRWIRSMGRSYFDETGAITRFAGVAQDVSQQIRDRQEAEENAKQYQLLLADLEEQVKQRTQELTRANQELQRSRNWLINIFEQAPVAIALLEGPEYRIRLANESLYAIWQLSPDQPSVLDRPVFEAFPGIAGIGLEELLDQVRRTGLPVGGKEQPAVFIRNGVAETAYINFVYAPIHDEHGRVDIVVIAIDVSEQVLARLTLEESEKQYRFLTTELEATNKELAVNNEEYAAINDKLEESNGLLVRSNENLQQFAYVASHDLQEPLRKIQQFSDLLKKRYPDTTGEELVYLDRMQSAASRMSTLIRDLLSFSRISTQRESSVPIALATVVQGVLVDLELVIEETDALIEVDNLPTIEGDRSQMGQLFQNLVGNALKFRQTNTRPHVRITSRWLSSDHLPLGVKPTRRAIAYHRIDVIDNGIGFDEKYLDRIFQVFQRLHGRGSFSGTGIGLAICEKVVANHGGAITASSQPGQGATFTVYLPV